LSESVIFLSYLPDFEQPKVDVEILNSFMAALKTMYLQFPDNDS